jgi:hypothetical protein
VDRAVCPLSWTDRTVWCAKYIGAEMRASPNEEGMRTRV